MIHCRSPLNGLIIRSIGLEVRAWLPERALFVLDLDNRLQPLPPLSLSIVAGTPLYVHQPALTD